MRGKNQEEKQQEIQTHKQERSTWHVSILPAISMIREGQWHFVRKENLSLWEGFCKFILKHDISNRRRTWACPRQKCVKERQVAIVAVVEVVKSYLVAIYPYCWVRYIWYISSWISALYFHKLHVPLFLHSLDLCTLSTRSVVCLHGAKSHNKIIWSKK